MLCVYLRFTHTITCLILEECNIQGAKQEGGFTLMVCFENPMGVLNQLFKTASIHNRAFRRCSIHPLGGPMTHSVTCRT